MKIIAPIFRSRWWSVVNQDVDFRSKRCLYNYSRSEHLEVKMINIHVKVPQYVWKKKVSTVKPRAMIRQQGSQGGSCLLGGHHVMCIDSRCVDGQLSGCGTRRILLSCCRYLITPRKHHVLKIG